MDDLETPDIPAEASAEPGDLPSSPIDALRKKRQELSEKRTEFFDIPGYDGTLVVEYRLMNYDEARQIGLKHRKKKDDPRRLFNSQVDTLIEACEGIYWRDDDGNLHPIDKNVVPTKFDQHLAEIMDIKGAETARQVVVQVFNNDIALIAHHMDVMQWMSTGMKESTEESGEA